VKRIVLALKGFLMGAADIVPGVSGGTMALITGIYVPLLAAIKSFNLALVQDLVKLRWADALRRVDWVFLTLLGTGILSAIVFFTRVIPLPRYMMSHPELVYGVFFGLIVGSIAIILLGIPKHERRWWHTFFVIGGAAFGGFVVTAVPADTPDEMWFLFLSGSVAICAMILPGISGSYILYWYSKNMSLSLSKIGDLGGPFTMDALAALIPFGLGAALGLALFARFLSWLLQRAHHPTMMTLIGFLIGSLIVLWPWQERTITETVEETFTISPDDPLVEELSTQEMDPFAMTFRRIVPSADVVSGASEQNQADENLADENQEMAAQNQSEVQVEEVSRKMTATAPFGPQVNQNRGKGLEEFLLALS
jgi:putative membrane protein